MAGVWDYGDADDIQPLTDSSDDENSPQQSYDELSLLPANKRRKLQKLNQSHKQVELIDLENEDSESQDKGLQDMYTSNKPAVKKAINSDSDSDLEYRPSVKRPPMSSIPLDPIILQNQALLQSFREAAQEPEEEELLPDPVPHTTRRHQAAAPDALAVFQGDDEDDEGSFDEEEPTPEPADDKVVLTMQCAEGKLQLRIGREMVFSKLFDIYKLQAGKKGWLPANKAASVRFVFDGDRLTGDETATELDLDNDDIIEVKW